MNRTFLAITYAIIACILWSGNFVVARGVHEWMLPIGFAFWRWVVALICVLPFALPHYKTDMIYFRRKPWPYIAMGVVGVGVFNSLVYESAKYTSANNIALLAATSPLWTVMLAGIFKLESLNRYKLIGIAIAFTGALTVILKGDINNIMHLQFNRGDVMMFAASWLWAVYSLLIKAKHPEMSPFFLMFLIIISGLASLTPLYAVEIAFHGFTPFTTKAIYCYLYVGICASMIAWTMFNQSVLMIGAIKTSLIYYSLPLFSGIMSIIFLGEHFYAYHITGFLLVVSGIAVSYIKNKP